MSLKESNEITVKINASIDEFVELLASKGYKLKKRFNMLDAFFVPQTLDVKKLGARDALAQAVIVRDITVDGVHYKKLTKKYKKFDDDGNIIEQSSINCDVASISDAKAFLLSIGYVEIMVIEEDDVVYMKDGFEIAIKDIKNGDKLIEIETDEKYDTIEKVKAKVLEEDLPIDASNFFVKKAEVELSKKIF